jgi:ADP-ribosylglycohydrolase
MAGEGLKRFFERSPRAPTRDLYHGVILGLAVGNALGIRGENTSREALRRLFPDGLREIEPSERECRWDDDTAQSVILAEALLEEAELDLAGFASLLVSWARENGRGMGNLTRRVISKLESGVPVEDASREVWEEDGREPAGNGAVMRCAPVALRWRRSSRQLIEVTMKSARVTHHDSRCVWSAVTLNGALALWLGGANPDLEDLARLLDSAGADTRVSAAVRGVRGCRLADLGVDDRETMGYTVKAMQIGLWALQEEPDFEAVLCEVVNAGGDTDTNGAVAGAVMGGRVGLAGIPPRWRESIRDESRLIDLADRLFDASEGRASKSAPPRPASPKAPPERGGGGTFDVGDLKRRRL